MNFEITKDNVQKLWELYEGYVEDFRKDHYSNINPMGFEYMVKNHMVYCENTMEYHWDDETFRCESCGEYYLEDEKGSSELAMQDCICEYCMEDGYGR